MKGVLPVLLISAFAAILALPVFAGSEEGLQVRVSTPLVSISLSHDAVNFGTLNLDEEKEASVFPVITNNGSVKVDLDMKGTDAAHGNDVWLLSGEENGDDQYMLMVSKDSDWDTEVLNLTTDYQEFYANPPLDPGSGQAFHIKILMPITTSAYGEYTANIYVRATQSGT